MPSGHLPRAHIQDHSQNSSNFHILPHQFHTADRKTFLLLWPNHTLPRYQVLAQYPSTSSPIHRKHAFPWTPHKPRRCCSYPSRAASDHTKGLLCSMAALNREVSGEQRLVWGSSVFHLSSCRMPRNGSIHSFNRHFRVPNTSWPFPKHRG